MCLVFCLPEWPYGGLSILRASSLCTIINLYFLKTIKIFKTYKVAQKIVFWALEKILSTDFSSD